MKNRIETAALGALLVALFSFSAGANGPYVEVGAGATFIPDQDIGPAGEVSADTGFNVGGAFGMQQFHYFRYELNLSYREAEIDEVTGPGFALDGAGNVGVFAAMANVYVDLLPKAPVIPYVGVGAGVSVVGIDSDSSANILRVDDSSTEFAWNVMAGASIPVTRQIYISLGYRYLATTDPELEAEIVGVGTGTIEGEFDAHEVMLGVRFRFGLPPVPQVD